MFHTKILPIKDKLYRFALRITGNVTLAEDVVQEVLIKVWDKKEELKQYNNLEAWCMRITKNLSIDKLRSKHQRTEGFKDGFDLGDTAATPYDVAASNDMIRHIRKLMQQLPEKQRMVMQLRDIEGMTYQEIVEVMDIPMNQVKVNLFRARSKMQKILKDLKCNSDC